MGVYLCYLKSRKHFISKQDSHTAVAGSKVVEPRSNGSYDTAVTEIDDNNSVAFLNNLVTIAV